MKNILYICPSTGVGGAETFLKHSFIHCDREKYKVHYLLFSQGPLYSYLVDNNASVYLTSHQPRLSKWGDQVKIRKQIRGIINEQKIDLVHSTMAYGALFGAWPAKQMNVKHIWFQHGPASGWMDRVASLLPHNGLAVNSHYTSQKQRELENPIRFFIPRCLPIEKILLGTSIKKPPDDQITSYRSQLLKKHNVDESKIIISMLCRIQPWKGVHVLLDALKELKEIHPKIHCFIWGDAFGGNDYFESLKKTISDNSLPATLVGLSDQVELALSSSDILVNASIQPEPFGLSIIEGMTVGAVPVVPNEGGPLEIISNGKDGLIFKARQAPDLAHKLKKLASDPELLKLLSDETMKTAENKFQASRAIKHLEQFYDKVLQS